MKFPTPALILLTSDTKQQTFTTDQATYDLYRHVNEQHTHTRKTATGEQELGFCAPVELVDHSGYTKQRVRWSHLAAGFYAPAFVGRTPVLRRKLCGEVETPRGYTYVRRCDVVVRSSYPLDVPSVVIGTLNGSDGLTSARLNGDLVEDVGTRLDYGRKLRLTADDLRELLQRLEA